MRELRNATERAAIICTDEKVDVRHLALDGAKAETTGTARDLEKLLRSAVANAENGEAAADVDDLVVSKIWVDEGPREKRIQPAPMGRAFRIQKRQAHVTVVVSDEVLPVGKKGRAAAEKKAKGATRGKAPARKKAAAKTSGTKSRARK